MLHCISHNVYYGTCFLGLLHCNRVNRLRRKQLISLAFRDLFQGLQVKDVGLRHVNLYRRFRFSKVTVEHLTNGPQCYSLVLAFDQASKARDGAFGQSVELALKRENFTVLTGARVERRRARKQSAATIAQRRSIVRIYFLNLHIQKIERARK